MDVAGALTEEGRRKWKQRLKQQQDPHNLTEAISRWLLELEEADSW